MLLQLAKIMVTNKNNNKCRIKDFLKLLINVLAFNKKTVANVKFFFDYMVILF